MSTYKIILARHSETKWNEELRYIGRTDLELSALGRRHAALLAEHLANESIARIYASNMKRAQETAVPVALGHDLKIEGEPDLREIDFGNWEGLTFDEISTAYPELADIWIEDPDSVHIPGGEPMGEFTARVRRSWSTIRESLISEPPDPGETVLIMTHAGCIKVILGEIMGLHDSKVWEIHQEKGALNHLEISAAEARILEINDIRYRQEPLGGANRD